MPLSCFAPYLSRDGGKELFSLKRILFPALPYLTICFHWFSISGDPSSWINGREECSWTNLVKGTGLNRIGYFSAICPHWKRDTYTYECNVQIDVPNVHCKTEGESVFLWLFSTAKVVNSVAACGPMYMSCAAALIPLLVLPLEGNHGAEVKQDSCLAEGFSWGLQGIQKVAAPQGCGRPSAVNLEKYCSSDGHTSTGFTMFSMARCCSKGVVAWMPATDI